MVPKIIRTCTFLAIHSVTPNHQPNLNPDRAPSHDLSPLISTGSHIGMVIITLLTLSYIISLTVMVNFHGGKQTLSMMWWNKLSQCNDAIEKLMKDVTQIMWRFFTSWPSPAPSIGCWPRTPHRSRSRRAPVLRWAGSLDALALQTAWCHRWSGDSTP